MKKLNLFLLFLLFFMAGTSLFAQSISPQFIWSYSGANTGLREFQLISPDSVKTPIRESDFEAFVSEKGLKNPVKFGVSDIESVLAVVDKGGVRWLLFPSAMLNKGTDGKQEENILAEEDFMEFIWHMIFAFSIHDLGYTAFTGKEQILAAEKNMCRFLVKEADYYRYSGSPKFDNEFSVSYRRLPAEPIAGYPGREERLGAFTFRYFELSDSLQKIAIKTMAEETPDEIITEAAPPDYYYADSVAAQMAAAAADVDYNAKESYIEIAETLPETSVKWEEETYNFKTVKEGEEVTHQFQLKNTGKNDLVITNVKPSCGCTASYCTKDVIKPGETCEVVVVFNSAGKEGYQNKTVTVTGNFKGDINKVLKITGEVIAKGQTEPEKKRKGRKEKMY
ncbi:MAG: DUF1573 domain-containing protein [Bacteroidia bacterium]|nr:DUF1573 domain-containing protein [Bacteroidia bacterium]